MCKVGKISHQPQLCPFAGPVYLLLTANVELIIVADYSYRSALYIIIYYIIFYTLVGVLNYTAVRTIDLIMDNWLQLQVHTEKLILYLVNSTQNRIEITLFRLIYHQTDFN